MKENNLTLFILDDNIPITPEYVEQELYDGIISSESLQYLVDNAKWTGQHNLKQLTSLILESEHAKSGVVQILGFTHPSLCLDEIDAGVKPDIVVYDWEYGSETNSDSSKWLMEILDSTDAFVFVYSMVRNDIPPFLNKVVFDKYSSRFQLFLKGDVQSSVFSSEEFILQYILSQITKTNRIRIQNIEMTFQKNGYLENPSDILYLEGMLGRITLSEKLKEGIYTISNESVEALLNDIQIKILHDKEKQVLVTADSGMIVKRIQPTRELSAVEVLKEYGLIVLKEVLHDGIVKI